MFLWLKSVPSSFGCMGYHLSFLSLEMSPLSCPRVPCSTLWKVEQCALSEQHHFICNSSVTKTVHGPHKHKLLAKLVNLSSIVQTRDQVLNNVKTKWLNIFPTYLVQQYLPTTHTTSKLSFRPVAIYSTTTWIFVYQD